MKTAKEMLVISETMRQKNLEKLYGEDEVMAAINEASNDGVSFTYVYGWLLNDQLIAKLKAHNYKVSEPIYEGKEGWESCISWGNES